MRTNGLNLSLLTGVAIGIAATLILPAAESRAASNAATRQLCQAVAAAQLPKVQEALAQGADVDGNCAVLSEVAFEETESGGYDQARSVRSPFRVLNAYLLSSITDHCEFSVFKDRLVQIGQYLISKGADPYGLNVDVYADGHPEEYSLNITSFGSCVPEFTSGFFDRGIDPNHLIADPLHAGVKGTPIYWDLRASQHRKARYTFAKLVSRNSNFVADLYDLGENLPTFEHDQTLIQVIPTALNLFLRTAFYNTPVNAANLQAYKHLAELLGMSWDLTKDPNPDAANQLLLFGIESLSKNVVERAITLGAEINKTDLVYHRLSALQFAKSNLYEWTHWDDVIHWEDIYDGDADVVTSLSECNEIIALLQQHGAS